MAVTEKTRRRGAEIFVGLLLLGAAVRIYGAWELRHHLNPDSGIVALMAKHMAEGNDFPVFFYGQAYMGSLEPLISALFCALFGCGGFMVALGTAFAGWLILPAVFIWARDAHSSKAGLIAMAYCVIGPLGFLHYQLSPRGGYPITILLDTLILWLSSKLIVNALSSSVGPLLVRGRILDGCAQARALQGRKYGAWFLLGLLAGLGWWSNQLIAGAIFTAALMALFFLRRKIISLNTVVAAGGFFIGSLPFWWWNVFNGWRSFEFAGSLGQTPFRTGLSVFFTARLPDLLDLNQGPLVWRLVRAAFFLAAAVWTALVLKRAFSPKQESRRIYLLTLFVFILVSILLFSTSHFARMNTSRYLLPLVPAIALMLGLATAELSRKIPVYFALIPLALLIVAQLGCMRGMARRGAGEEQYQRQIEECGRFLRAQGIRACYTPYGKHGWNFALREEICFCDLPIDRYKPYAQRAELADRIAVFDNFGEINNFISNYGGSARLYFSDATPILYDFIPPREGLTAVSPAEIASIRDALERDALSETTDGNLDTCWESGVAHGDSDWLEITFQTPQKIGLARLLFEEYPESWQMEGQLETGRWKILTPGVQTAGYIWPGPRPYWSYGLNGYRLECRIAPEKLKSLRIHRLETGWRLAEIRFFASGPAPESEESALPELLNVIRERRIKRLYGDRWPATAVFRATHGAAQTSLDQDIFKECLSVLSNKVAFTPHTGFLVRQEDEAQCKMVLDRRLIEMRRTNIGPWVLFDFEPGKWKPEYARDSELHWAGFACLAKNNKRWAAELVGRADLYCSAGKKSEAAALLQAACEAWPLYQPAVARLAAEPGGLTDAEYWQAEHKKLQPEFAAEIKFDNGVALAGFSLSTSILAAGDAFTIKYFWQYPESGVKGRPCVFVHFSDGENILQDDHLLGKFAGAEYQPYPELFIETRRLILPATARPGEYQVRIGLYDDARKDQRRVNVNTALPNRLNAVELPVKLRIMKNKRNGTQAGVLKKDE